MQVKVRKYFEEFSDKLNEFNSIKEDEFISKLSDNLKFEYIK